jgi:sugar phosphate isomerase/epimerase
LMLDVFHMAVEGEDVVAGIGAAQHVLWHVHFADTDRQVPGDGRLDFSAIVTRLRQIGYARYVTAEVKQEPDSAVAARRTAAFLKPILNQAVCMSNAARAGSAGKAAP